MTLPDIPKATADYINFIIDFGSSPSKAVSAYKGTGSVNPDLVTFSALGAGLTWLILLVLKHIADAHNDKSDIIALIGKGDIETIPLFALDTIILLSIIFHLAMRLVLKFQKRTKGKINTKKGAHISINLKDTINGALAFFSFAPVVISLTFLFGMIFLFTIRPPQPKLNVAIALMISVGPTVVLLLALIFFYFPTALSGVQSTMDAKEARNIFYTIVGIVFVVFWFLSGL